MTIYNKTFQLAASLLLSSSLFSASLMAAEPTQKNATAPVTPQTQQVNANKKIDENTVLVTVNGKNITYHDVLAMRQMLPDQYKALPAPMLNSIILQQLIVQNAIVQLAEKANLQNSPEVKQQIDMMQKEALIQAYQKTELKKELQNNPINDTTLQNYYKEHYVNAPPVKEAHIRHILVKTEAEAKKIINELHAGKKFAALAKQYSTDKETGSENGGELGWIKQKDPLDPTFLNAAFALKPNSITDTPVKTQFGWHVIQVLAYRNAPVPPFDKVKGEINKTLYQEKMKSIMENAIKQSQITKNDDAIKNLTQPPAAPQPNQK